MVTPFVIGVLSYSLFALVILGALHLFAKFLAAMRPKAGSKDGMSEDSVGSFSLSPAS